MAAGGAEARAAVALLLLPLLGRGGRRRPRVVCGTFGTAAMLLLLSSCTSLSSFVLVWMGLQVASNAGSAAFMCLLPDTVPAAQLGLANVRERHALRLGRGGEPQRR